MNRVFSVVIEHILAKKWGQAPFHICAESLATLLTLPLFRTYSVRQPRPSPHTGGLPPHTLRLVRNTKSGSDWHIPLTGQTAGVFTWP